MNLHAETTLDEDADLVFARARDELHGFALHMPDVASFEPLRTIRGGPSFERTDRVGARVAPVSIAGKRLSEARWLLHSSWHAPSRTAHWQVDVEYPVDALHAGGLIEVLPRGPGAALLRVHGTLRLRPEAVGLGLFGKAMASSIERVVAGRVETNLRRMLEAAHRAQRAA